MLSVLCFTMWSSGSTGLYTVTCIASNCHSTACSLLFVCRLVQADRLGAAPAFDAAGKIGDLHTEALSLQVLHLACSVVGASDLPQYPCRILESDYVCVCVA